MSGCAGINVDDLLLKNVAFFLAESYGYGLKTRLRQKNKQLFFLHKVNIYTYSATYVSTVNPLSLINKHGSLSCFLYPSDISHSAGVLYHNPLPMLARSPPLGLVPKGPRGNPSGALGTGTGATGGSWPIGGDLYKHLHSLVHVDRPLDSLFPETVISCGNVK